MSRQLKEAHSDVQDKEQKLVELVEKLVNEKEIQDKEKCIAELKLTVTMRRLERVRSFNVLRRVYRLRKEIHDERVGVEQAHKASTLE